MEVVGISSEEQVIPHLILCNEKQEILKYNLCIFSLLFCSSFQDGIFRVVAAILHLGNIEFAKGKEADSSVPKDEKSWFHLRTAAELFM